MRILHLYKDYAPVVGGIENHIRLLAEAQAAAGHEVTVLVTSPTAHTTVETIGSLRVIKAARLATVASTPLSLRYAALLRAQHPDVTHLHFPYPLAEVSQYLLGRGRPLVITYHSDVIRQQSILRLYRPLMLRALARANCILATSPNYLAASPVLARVAERCRVVPLGIDRRPFLASSEADAAPWRARCGSGPLLLFVGVLRYYKGLQYLLAALPQIAGARLLVVGDGPMRPELERQIAELGLGERVILAGRVPDAQLPGCYRAADLFCLPAAARSEAFGLVQVEAMSSGLPVISTELGTGTSYVNRHGESGWVVPPCDPAALAHAANALLADPAERRRLAEGALRRSQQFDAERIVAAVEAAYREVCAGDGR